MTARTKSISGRRVCALLLVGTILGGVPLIARAQTAATPAPAALLNPAPPAPAPATDGGTIKSINVTGAQRIEPETVRSYIQLRTGAQYTRETLDQALQDLFATELFADVQIRDDNGALTIIVRENPVINRIVFEGNKRIKEEKLTKELKLAPRQIFTRSKVRADIARIVELYRRQGRFAASVEPKMVLLDQNRVDIVYEISEGPKSKVRQINIIGNTVFSDGDLRAEMVTKRSRFYRFFSSNASYDPDRLAYDQSKLRQFYLTHGYADFRVVSAVAELTPDKRDFIITYVVEEGDRYKFGEVAAESDIRDFKPETVKALLPMHQGDWYNAKLVEDTVDNVTQTAGLLGYAFAQVDPQFERDPATKTMGITFRVADAPRVYVEAVNINGNTTTQDKVIRREFRLAEGDAFNAFLVKRSSDRIQSLGFFQDKLEITQKQGSAPDRVILEANIEEKSTGELQLSAGYSSLERFIINASITQRNFRGKGQELRTSVNYSTYSKSIELGFTEPYLFNRNIAVGGDIFRRDYNSFNFTQNGNRNTTYSQVQTGFQLRMGVPITEYVSLALRYGLSYDDVSLNKNTYYLNGQCSPLLAGRYLCDAIGNRLTSSIGYSLVYDSLNNRIRPSRGNRVVFNQDIAGLGGDVRYVKSTADASKYWNLGHNFILQAHLEGGYVLPYEKDRGPGIDAVRLTDRFFLGEPQIRGFDIRGVGPRVRRINYVAQTNTVTNPDGTMTTNTTYVPATTQGGTNLDDSIGGRAYYLGRLELELPLSAAVKELGIRPSIFIDAGAVFGVRKPNLVTRANTFTDANGVVGPKIIPILDSSGRQLYVVPATLADGTAAPNANLLTICSVGYSANTTDPCVGTLANNANISSIDPFEEVFLGNSAKPRLSIGFGFNWNSPFGPFRFDIAKALLHQKGDDTKLFTFNVGTQF